MPIKKPVASKAKAETKSNPVKKAAVAKPVAKKAVTPKKVVAAKSAVKKAAPAKKAPAKVVAKVASKPKVAVKKAAPAKKVVAAKKPAAKKVAPKTVAKVAVAKKTPVKKNETKQVEPVKASAEKTETLKTLKSKPLAEKKSVKKSAETLKQEKIDARKLSEIKVLVQTNVGNIELVLDQEKAPTTVANFLKYISEKHYDGLIFHRVIPNFMIQGGGYEEQGLTLRPTSTAIKIESHNGLKNLRGTIAMARTNDPNSATSQFFINLVDNIFLDFKEKTIEGYGYTVFGKVIKGMDVVDRIGAAPTTKYLYHDDLPTNVIRIETMKLTKSDA